jgi:hypothetical protein
MVVSVYDLPDPRDLAATNALPSRFLIPERIRFEGN